MPYKYPQTTIKRLFALSNNICYFPNCSIKMIDDNKSIIGEICHIEGENKGSARFNSRMSVKERNNFKNLILMCPNHHTFIDANISEYPVDVLKDIKENYENTNREKLYNIPNDVLKILNVAINYDEYSIERLHNFLKLYTTLKGQNTKQLGYDHLRYLINGLKFSSHLSKDEKDAIKIIFNNLKEFSINDKNDQKRMEKNLELLNLFLDKLPIDIKEMYINELKPKIEILVNERYNNIFLPILYKYLNKPIVETINYLIKNANTFDEKVFERFIDDIKLQEIAKDKTNFIDLEYKIWKEFDKYDQKNRNENIGYKNLNKLITKFFYINI